MAVSLDEKKNFTLKKSEEAFNAAKVTLSLSPDMIFLFGKFELRWVLVYGFDCVKEMVFG